MQYKEVKKDIKRWPNSFKLQWAACLGRVLVR
jgi:hypothetical protein